MKIVSYKSKNTDEAFRTGILEADNVFDLREVHTTYQQAQGERNLDALLPANPNDFFSLGNTGMEKARMVFQFIKENQDIPFLKREAVSLGTPISKPGKIICVGKNYAKHAEEMKSDVPDYPVLFSKFSNALIGPEDRIEKPAVTNQLDYEVELVAVIGKEAKNVKQSEALDYIAGYAIGNDTSARDLQKRTAQWLQGKTLDKTTPIGPWVVSAKDIGDPSNLSIKSYVNGELRQSSNTSHLIFTIPFLIEYISQVMTLEPGDLIMTGTPDGVGFAMDPPGFVDEGDRISLEIENIGKMENKVVSV